ncbi:MAG TPA: branched-chain amino acid ABC transporter ATP-binding protein/permease [Rhodocyclaceae bacterium]|nr:branched-chain amino acid ABC transporter ATP-binding protein/permease [Rhodocyclaceae bacterium]
MPARSTWIAAILALVIVALPFTGLMPPYWVTLFNYIGISSLVAIGLVLLTGVGGMTSFGQAAFVGLGAYTTGALTVHFGMSPWLALPLALAVTGLGALLIGALTVRLSGHYLPIGTIAWGIALFYLFGNLSWLGAHDGLSGIPTLRIGDHALTEGRQYFIVVWLAVVSAVVAVQNLLGGRTGRAVRALRRSTAAAEAFGVNVAGTKLKVFVFAALLAGLAGWLYAHFQRSVAPGPFGVNAGIEYLLMAVVGGAGRVYGAILGATAITFLRDQLQNILPVLVGAPGNYEIVVFGAVLVFALQAAPAGLWPILFGPPRPGRLARRRPSAALGRRSVALRGAPLLDVRSACKRYGGLVAVDDVGFDVKAGEIVGLIGPNGAGKSTTFNLICGAQKLNSGEIVFRDASIAGATPQRIAARGLGRTFQHADIVADMSVLENVALGAHLRGEAGLLRAVLRLDRTEEGRLLDEAMRQLERVGLAPDAHKPAGSLALGQMRLVEVARALCLDPVLVLMDEPAAGLRFGEKKALAGLLRELRSDGVSVLLIEHDMDFVMSVADRLVVLDFGRKIAEGAPAAVRSDPRVRDAYLGGIAS